MASHTPCSRAHPAIARGRATLPIASFLNGLQEFHLISSQHSFFRAFSSSLNIFTGSCFLSAFPRQVSSARAFISFQASSCYCLPADPVLLPPVCESFLLPVLSRLLLLPLLNYYSSFLCRCTHTFGFLLGDAEIIQKQQQQLPRAWIQEQPPSPFPRSVPGDVPLFPSVIRVFETPEMCPQGKKMGNSPVKSHTCATCSI